MSSDLKIEIFAYNLFNIYWNLASEIKTKPNILKIYGDECRKVDYEEVCDDLFFTIISLRHSMFNKIYQAEFTDEKAKSLKSIYDCYDYMITTCDRKDLFGHLSIFQRMFATLNFVQFICLLILKKVGHSIDVVKYGYLIWTMYFDKYTEEFYEKGGWKELLKEAKLYTYLYDFAHYFYRDSSLTTQAIKQSCDNYTHFKNSVAYEQKQMNPVHISYLWIKFRIEYSERYIHIPLISMDAYDMERLFEDLKLLLNPSTCNSNDIEISEEENQGSTLTHKISYSKILCSPEKINANLDDDSKADRVTFVYENRIIDKSSDDFSQISTTNVEESQSRCSTSVIDEFNIMDSNGNQELYEDTVLEMKQRRKTSNEEETALNTDHNYFIGKKIKTRPETSDENLPKVSDFELKPRCNRSHLDKKAESSIRYFYGDNAEGQNEIANTNQLININHAKEIECNNQTSIRNQDHSILAESVNNLNEKKNPEEKLEMSAFSSTEELKEVSNTIDAVSTSDIGVFDFDGLSLDPVPNELKSVNENAIRKEEREGIRKARKNLRSEQEDPEVQNILKLLLVLGGGKGVKFLFSSLQSEKEAPEKSQKISNKEKKRTKKKNSRK